MAAKKPGFRVSIYRDAVLHAETFHTKAAGRRVFMTIAQTQQHDQHVCVLFSDIRDEGREFGGKVSGATTLAHKSAGSDEIVLGKLFYL